MAALVAFIRWLSFLSVLFSSVMVGSFLLLSIQAVRLAAANRVANKMLVCFNMVIPFSAK